MARKKTYRIGVVFGHTIELEVKAKNLEEAKDKAETEASEEFGELLNDGLLGTSDFSYEAYRI